MTPDTDETARQRALDSYRILDTLPEQAYDDIVRLAAEICETPIALVSLIDRERQWLKARTGLALSETSRDIAFCDHAIREPRQLMQVPDAQRDPRFLANPLVTGDTAVRFYAGVPLVTPAGEAIGTVCVLDHVPRQLGEAQQRALASLARLTMHLMDCHQREREHERAGLLARAAQAEAPTAPGHPVPAPPPQRSVVLFELQGFARAAERLGGRALERSLQDLQEALEALLPAGRGDSLSRASGSGELVAVLHGDDVSGTVSALQDQLTRFERETGLRVFSASARGESPEERLDQVFLRADEALSQAKDLRCAA